MDLCFLLDHVRYPITEHDNDPWPFGRSTRHCIWLAKWWRFRSLFVRDKRASRLKFDLQLIYLTNNLCTLRKLRRNNRNPRRINEQRYRRTDDPKDRSKWDLQNKSQQQQHGVCRYCVLFSFYLADHIIKILTTSKLLAAYRKPDRCCLLRKTSPQRSFIDYRSHRCRASLTPFGSNRTRTRHTCPFGGEWSLSFAVDTN